MAQFVLVNVVVAVLMKKLDVRSTLTIGQCSRRAHDLPGIESNDG